MNHSMHVRCLLLALFTFGATAVPLHAASSRWESLYDLEPGKLIRVELLEGKSYPGTFQAVNNVAITIRRAAGDQTFVRTEVVGVSVRAKNHLLRNMLIGGAIGALFFALPFDLANNRNGWWRSNAWEWWVFAPAGAGVGAWIPTGGWHQVYRAH